MKMFRDREVEGGAGGRGGEQRNERGPTEKEGE
jgi:hypothetical protein